MAKMKLFDEHRMKTSSDIIISLHVQFSLTSLTTTQLHRSIAEYVSVLIHDKSLSLVNKNEKCFEE